MKNVTCMFVIGISFVLIATVILSILYPGPGDYNFAIGLAAAIGLFLLSILLAKVFIPKRYREKIMDGIKAFFDAVVRNI